MPLIIFSKAIQNLKSFMPNVTLNPHSNLTFIQIQSFDYQNYAFGKQTNYIFYTNI